MQIIHPIKQVCSTLADLDTRRTVL